MEEGKAQQFPAQDEELLGEGVGFLSFLTTCGVYLSAAHICTGVGTLTGAQATYYRRHS